MAKSREQIEAEGRRVFTERMLSQHLPQTEEQKERAKRLEKRLNEDIKKDLQKQGYDLQELGIENL
ncbi:MAG: hypothetical protein Q4A67_02175 [Aerococcus sp.]|nr:hypothetical protein [Aerococcus sp.]